MNAVQLDDLFDLATADNQYGPDVDALRAEFTRLRRIEWEARDLVRKLNEHERRHYGHIKVGALHALRDAVGEVEL